MALKYEAALNAYVDRMFNSDPESQAMNAKVMERIDSETILAKVPVLLQLTAEKEKMEKKPGFKDDEAYKGLIRMIVRLTPADQK